MTYSSICVYLFMQRTSVRLFYSPKLGEAFLGNEEDFSGFGDCHLLVRINHVGNRVRNLNLQVALDE